MAKYGIPEKFIAIVKPFHEGILARVLDGDESSETVQVTNGVKQGCVLAPTICSVVFSAMLKTAFHDDSDSMAIRYRTDGKLFNLRRLQAKSKVKEERVRDFLSANDCALKASSEDAWYAVEHQHVFVCLRYLWTRNQHKENGGHISAHTNYSDPTITVKGQKLQTVVKFTYLGSTVCRILLIDDEI